MKRRLITNREFACQQLIEELHYATDTMLIHIGKDQHNDARKIKTIAAMAQALFHLDPFNTRTKTKEESNA